MTQCELLIIGTAPQNYMQVRRDMCVCVCVCVCVCGLGHHAQKQFFRKMITITFILSVDTAFAVFTMLSKPSLNNATSRKEVTPPMN